MNDQAIFMALIGACALIFAILVSILLKWEWMEDSNVEVDDIDLNALRGDVLAALAAKRSMEDLYTWLLEAAIKYESFYGGSDDLNWDENDSYWEDSYEDEEYEDDSDEEALVTFNGSARWQRWTLEDHLSRVIQETDNLLEDLEILQEELEVTKFRVETRGLSLLAQDARNHRGHYNHSVGYKNRR